MKKVVVAVVVLSVAVLSFWAGGRYGKGPSAGTGSQGEREVLYYVDPMTPGFRSDKPGIAPCGMPLEPMYAETGEGQKDAPTGGAPPHPGAVNISMARQQMIGVKVAAMEIKPVTYTLRLYGRIIPDETRIYRINASVDSWVRALSDMTTGSIVAKDQVLAEILAPAFYNAQVTYLVTLNNIDRIQEQMGGELRHQQTEIADNRIRVAVQSLQNLGITDAQVEELANTRKAQPLMQVRSPANGVVLDRNISLYQWFKAGEELYRVADIGRVWVYADVYEDEARHLRPGMVVKVTHPQTGRTYAATVSPVLPLFDPVSKTLKVRLDVDNPRYDLRPDMFVDVEIPITMPPSMNVPADAVINSGTRTIVYVDAGNGAFEPRKVETGWRLGRQVEITGGLMPGEKIIVSGNFLIDSESRMKTAALGHEPEMSLDPVCGMQVDAEKAVVFGRVATHSNETFYFCMDQCKESFEKKPEKYVQKIVKNVTDVQHRDKQVMDKSWLEMLESARNAPIIDDDASAPEHRMKGTIGNPATFPGVVDWDGPNPAKKGEPPRDWSGWGKFPGSRYLGMEDEKKKDPALQDDTPEAGSERSGEGEQSGPEVAPKPDAHGSDMKHSMHEQPATNPLRPAAK